MDSALYIVLGWLLGLLGHRIVDKIDTNYKRPEIKRSIFVELERLRGNLASVSLILRIHIGILDKSFLKWFEPMLKRDRSFYMHPDTLRVAAELSKVENDELIKVSAIFREIKSSNQGLNMKKYSLPFVTMNIASLKIFPNEFQQNVLEIRERLDILNEEIDAAWFYYSKTFDSSLSPQNHEILRGNADQCYKNLAHMTKDMADHISRILSMWQSNNRLKLTAALSKILRPRSLA